MIELAGERINRLGMGCWAIGGPFFAGDDPLGYGEVDDAESIRAIHAAIDLGVRFFDTADVYGAGHSETVLGTALAGRTDTLVASKFGLRFDAVTKQVVGPGPSPAYAVEAVEASLHQLRRDRIDLVFLHLNALEPAAAGDIFDALDTLREQGKIRSVGWSTDFPASAEAVANRAGFEAVQHAMNLFFDAPSMMRVVEASGLVSVNRSPLAMGLLTGKFAAGGAAPAGDIRQNTYDWMSYFKDGRAVPAFVEQLDVVRDLLQTGGRTLAQGAIGWLWARSPRSLPIPGFRTEAQVRDNAGALEKGPLPADVMDAIEARITREPEGEPRER